MGNASKIQCSAAGKIRYVGDVGAAHHAGIVDRDIREEAIEVDVLLRVRVDQVVKRMSRDGENGLAIELCIVEPI